MQDQEPGWLIGLEEPVGHLASAHHGMEIGMVGNGAQDLLDPWIVQVTRETNCRSGRVHAAPVPFSEDGVIPLTQRELAGNREPDGDGSIRKVSSSRKKLYPERSRLT